MRLVISVDGYQNPTDHPQGKLQIDPLRNISGPDGYFIASFDAHGHETLGSFPATGIKITIILAKLKFRLNQGWIFRIIKRRLLNHLADCFINKTRHKD